MRKNLNIRKFKSKKNKSHINVEKEIKKINKKLDFIMNHLHIKDEICFTSKEEGGCSPSCDFNDSTPDYENQICNDFCKNPAFTNNNLPDTCLKFYERQIDNTHQAEKDKIRDGLSFVEQVTSYIPIVKTLSKHVIKASKSDIVLNKILKAKKKGIFSLTKTVKYSKRETNKFNKFIENMTETEFEEKLDELIEKQDKEHVALLITGAKEKGYLGEGGVKENIHKNNLSNKNNKNKVSKNNKNKVSKNNKTKVSKNKKNNLRKNKKTIKQRLKKLANKFKFKK